MSNRKHFTKIAFFCFLTNRNSKMQQVKTNKKNNEVTGFTSLLIKTSDSIQSKRYNNQIIDFL